MKGYHGYHRNQHLRRCFAVILALCLVSGSMQGVFGAAGGSGNSDSLAGNLPKVEETVKDTINNLMKAAPEPAIGSVGGDWLVMGIARSGFASDSESQAYISRYIKNAADYLKKSGGILNHRKYTEYARVVLAMTAIGKDASNLEGYNLAGYLEDYDKTVYQGVNGAAYGLIALDSGSYDGSADTKNAYIKYILDRQLADGGFTLSGAVSDPDVTAMALQALAKYTDRSDVAAAVEKALYCLSEKQNEQAGFTAWGETNSETTSQVITALCELGIDPADSRFVKNDKTLLDHLMSYAVDGGFAHSQGDAAVNLMAGEQALYALVSYERYLKGETSLYRMTTGVSSGGAPAGTDAPGTGDTAMIPYEPAYTAEDVKRAVESIEMGLWSVALTFF